MGKLSGKPVLTLYLKSSMVISDHFHPIFSTIWHFAIILYKIKLGCLVSMESPV